jgi:hypothetical protein
LRRKDQKKDSRLIGKLIRQNPASFGYKLKENIHCQGGAEFQPAGILKYSGELKRDPNAEIGPKGFLILARYSHRAERLSNKAVQFRHVGC